MDVRVMTSYGKEIQEVRNEEALMRWTGENIKRRLTGRMCPTREAVIRMINAKRKLRESAIKK